MKYIQGSMKDKDNWEKLQKAIVYLDSIKQYKLADMSNCIDIAVMMLRED